MSSSSLPVRTAVGNRGPTRRIGRVALVVSLTAMLLGQMTNPVSAKRPPGGVVAVSSVRSGDWSDPKTWGGQAPDATRQAMVSAGHTVNVTADAIVRGVTVDVAATLRFDPSMSATLASSANVVVNGILVMRPAAAAISHTLRFIEVDERAFVGGGMNPVDSDVGLWVVGAGQLDLAGTPKTAWTRAGSISAGATSVSLDDTPSGWRPGDALSIAPTAAPTVGDSSWSGFDEVTLAGVSGASATTATAVTRDHPKVNGQWGAEVMNLTRNVAIEGTPAGRSHVLIRSSRPQSILYTVLRHMGPRQGNSDVAGRYGLHFHHSLDGSRGSLVLGTVVRDTDSHAFVTHNSHGVTYKDDISYNTIDDAYWWDPGARGDKEGDGEPTNDTVLDRNVAALVKAGHGTSNRVSGFTMGAGENNLIRDSVAVGVQGVRDASGFKWPESGPSVWDFSRGNVAHNNKVDGIFIWQNGGPVHVIAGFVGYHNGEAGIDHGAYFNRYRFENSALYGNGRAAVDLRAVSGTSLDQSGILPSEQIRFDNVVLDGAGISPDLVLSYDHTAPGTNRPTYFRNATFRGADTAFRSGGNRPNEINVESSTFLTATDVAFDPGARSADTVRIAGFLTATEVTPGGRRTVAYVPSLTDTSPPEASIVTPIGGSIVSGLQPVTTAIYDLVGVHRVEFIVDGVVRAEAVSILPMSAPPTFSWDTAGLTSGTHTLRVKGYDAVGSSRWSPLVTVFVR